MGELSIVVLGAGPAGAAAAIGLKRLGYRVTAVSNPRPFDSLEAVSERVVAGMRAAGFERAVSRIAEASPRQATWAGQTLAANTEHLVRRSDFDQALLSDLEDQGVDVVVGRVRGYEQAANQWQVTIETAGGHKSQLQGQFLVESRGRATPGSGVPRIKGPQTVSLLQHWQGPPLASRTGVESFPDGWAWLAARSDGRRYLQLTLDAESAHLPAKPQLSAWFTEKLRTLTQVTPFIEGAQPVGEVYGRTSTAILSETNVGERWIRVGDAAMAVDPLSGNGMFQALSSALQAPAVINTIIRYPERAELAKKFYEDRVESLFYRFARIGRDFYQTETAWGEIPFWSKRAVWPDSQPMHVDVTPETVKTALRPVVEDGVIDKKKVVVTPDSPLGIWHLNGLPMADLLDIIKSRPGKSPQLVLIEALGHQKGKALADWMENQGWISGKRSR